MSVDGWTLAAILCMAAASFLCRAGGYWLFRQIRPGPGVRAMLSYIPGALFVSYVVPALAAGGAAQWIGAAAVLALSRVSSNLSVMILGGTAAAWAVWALR